MFVEGVGEVAYVSRQAMQEATLDAEAVVARIGGHFSVSTDRHPTGFPGEMVTTAAAFEWRDRTDAKEQPEQAAPVATPVEPMKHAQQFEYEQGAVDEADVVETEAPTVIRDSIDDGLDPATLEEEDFDSVPESAR
jgi:hypothetical protein